MQHYQLLNQPWYVQRSIDNNPLRNNLHLVGGSNGLESVVSGIYVNNDANGHFGYFGYIGRVAGGISSAITDSVKKIAAVSGLAALLGLLYFETACSSPVQNPYVPSAPTPVISQKIVQRTSSELISELFDSPNKHSKYKIGTVIRVSGVVVRENTDGIADSYIYLGPITKGVVVRIGVRKYTSEWDVLMRVREGDRVVVEGDSPFLHEDTQMVILSDGKLISKE